MRNIIGIDHDQITAVILTIKTKMKARKHTAPHGPQTRTIQSILYRNSTPLILTLPNAGRIRRNGVLGFLHKTKGIHIAVRIRLIMHDDRDICLQISLERVKKVLRIGLKFKITIQEWYMLREVIQMAYILCYYKFNTSE